MRVFLTQRLKLDLEREMSTSMSLGMGSSNPFCCLFMTHFNVVGKHIRSLRRVSMCGTLNFVALHRQTCPNTVSYRVDVTIESLATSIILYCAGHRDVSNDLL